MMKKGETLIEVMIGMAIVVALMPALITAYAASRGGKGQEKVRSYASERTREAAEILSLVKTADWNSVVTNGRYHLNKNSGVWSLLPGEEMLSLSVTRSIDIMDAYRDSTGKLASSGTVDPSTKHVVITSSWPSFVPSSVSLDYYLMRLENLIRTETTAAEFNPGTKSGTTVTNLQGGEITLGAGGASDWCDPRLTISAYDLPKSGVANAISAVEGEVLAGTGENASGVSMANVLISNTRPPAASEDATFDGYKTNSVFTTGAYAYLATDTNSREVEIVNLGSKSAGKFAEAGYYNSPGNGNAGGVFVNGNLGFVTVGSDLYVFDNTGLPNTGTSRATKASITLSGTGGRLTVSGSYIYVTLISGSNALQIIEYTVDGSGNVTLALRGNVALGGGQTGRDIVLNTTATRGYLAASQHVTQPEFYIIDLSDKNGSRPVLGSYQTGDMQPKGVAVVTAGKAILVGAAGEEYQVVAMRDNGQSVSVTRCGGLNIDTGVNGVVGIVERDGDAFAYIVTGDASSELKIIEGGPGGEFSMSGTYESVPFDAGRSVVFNRLEFTADVPSETSVRAQVAVAQPVSGSCNGASYTYVGPDLTGNTFYSSPGQIPFGTSSAFTNPGQCFRYKLYLDSQNVTDSPQVLDVSVNYSP